MFSTLTADMGKQGVHWINKEEKIDIQPEPKRYISKKLFTTCSISLQNSLENTLCIYKWHKIDHITCTRPFLLQISLSIDFMPKYYMNLCVDKCAIRRACFMPT